MVVIGSARMGENGSITGGIPGDQKQGQTPDMVGEVSMQAFYVHKKGWHVLRPKQKDMAARLALAMKNACNNPMIGYNQLRRDGVVKYGTASRTYCNCDCSSLVRQCVKEASGIDPGNFTTGNEAAVLERTGLFEKRIAYTAATALQAGDVLVTRTKGHTAIVVSSDTPQEPAGKPIEVVVREVLAGKWGDGAERRRRLTEAGYDYDEVQKHINATYQRQK